jgi:transcriptional regulator with XRE-family HTH domain
MHLGLRIKLARISKGLKQEELAEKINRTRPLISNIEQTGKANHYTLKKICEVLDLDINELESSVVAEPTKLNDGFQQQQLFNLTNKIKDIEEDNHNLRSLVSAQSELIKKQKEFINKQSKKLKF